MSLFSAYKRRLNKRQNQRGAALVEAAIIFVPLCLIVFGIIEYGFIFKDSLTLSSATRAGARTASAMPVTDDQTVFSPTVEAAVARAASAGSFKPGDQMWIYKAKDDGSPSGSCTGSYTNCIVYTFQAGGTWQRVAASGWDTNKVNACLGGVNPAGNIDSVGIRLSLTHDAITGFFHGMNLHERTVMKFEPTKNCS